MIVVDDMYRNATNKNIQCFRLETSFAHTSADRHIKLRDPALGRGNTEVHALARYEN